MLRLPFSPAFALASIATLLALTTTARADTAFERGLERFQAEDFRGALPLLEQAHADEPADADTALLLGIAYYRTEQSDRARPLLERAERDGDTDAKASARIFLGLIADEHGQDERAQVFYEQVARDSPELGASARLLIDQAGPSRWLLVGVMRPGFDSNVPLMPMTAGQGHGKGSADAELNLVLAMTARPIESVPLVLDQTLNYSKQAQLTDYDMLADRVGATYTLLHGKQRGTIAYHLEASRMGGERYQLGHVAEATGRHRLRNALALRARYTFAARSYGMAYDEYSGLSHGAIIEILHGTRSRPLEIAAGYHVEREGAASSRLTMLGHGPRADARLRMWRTGELRSSLIAADRMFEHRRDLYLALESALYIDLSSVLGLVSGATFTVDESTDKQSSYIKWTVFAGVIVVVSS